METLQKEVEDLSERLDHKVFRLEQKRTFQCSAKCCDSAGSSRRDFEVCLEQCARELQRKEMQVNEELAEFQGKVQRCVVACNDRARGLVESVGVDKAQHEMMKCVDLCVRDYSRELKNVTRRVGL